MSHLSGDEVLARIKQLPALPSAVSSVLASFANEDADIGEIAAQIARDQGLAARVLRVANSSFYGLQTRVGTINEALVVLGFRAVRSMVLAAGMSGAFRLDHCPDFDAAAYLRHGIATGLVARRLAPLVRQNAELAFTAGLLHDIGELVLAAIYPERYEAVLALRQREDRFVVEAEREVLGIDHGEVGGLLAQAWRFPPALYEAAAFHHRPDDAPAGFLAGLIHLADATAHALSLNHGCGAMVMPVADSAWAAFDPAAYRRALAGVEAEFDGICQALAA